MALRECPSPESMVLVDDAAAAFDYWRSYIETEERFSPDVECFVVLFLNTRRRVKGHSTIAIGALDSLVVHPREVFRTAIVSSASAIILMHNHPSGDASPSQTDVRVTRELIRAGRILKIDVLDHVIVGYRRYLSLRELGHFYE